MAQTGLGDEALLALLDGWLRALPDDIDGDDAFEALLERLCAEFSADEEAEMDFAEFLQSVWD